MGYQSHVIDLCEEKREETVIAVSKDREKGHEVM